MRDSPAVPRSGRRAALPVGGRVIALLTVLTAAGCASSDNGSPVAAATGATGPGPQGSAPNPSPISLPPRPRSLPLTQIDPCTLLTGAQQTKLGVDPGVAGHPDVHWHDPQCGFQLVDPGTLPSYNLQTVTATGIQFWLNPLLADTVEPVTGGTVAGYPAIDVTSKAATSTSCQTVVSVADGQMLIVQFDFPPSGMTAAQSCGHTEQVAAAAVTTLQTAN